MSTVPVEQAFALALQHHQAGRLAEAEALYRQILTVQPNHAEALHFLGVIAQQAGRHDLAVDLIRQSLALTPNSPAAHSNLGEAYRAMGRLDEAMASYRRALALKPEYAEAYNNLGIALGEQGQLDGAVAAYRQALQLKPDYAEAENNLGNTLRDHGHIEEAAARFQRALALNPRYSEGHLNMGVTWWLKGHFHEAEACYRRAITFRADFADAHFNLGMLLILLGRYEEGWHEYEWRWRSPTFTSPYRHFSAPQWDGTPAVGKTILIHSEQGYGDTLQFLRFLPLVCAHSHAAQVLLECQPALVPLLQQLRSPNIEIIARTDFDEMLPPFDVHLPLLSLPLALQRFAPVSLNSPYLHAESGLRSRWRERLGSGAALRVGLAWAGNPAHFYHRRRTIAPEKLAPLLHVPGIRFVSLQVEPRNPLPPTLATAGVLDFTAEIANFSDSAALMAELDLIITADTATAHIAGALGRPVWVLLPFVPDWRWGLESEQTPWYPTMRLFRQPAAGDWDAVIQRVVEELSRAAAERASEPEL